MLLIRWESVIPQKEILITTLPMSKQETTLLMQFSNGELLLEYRNLPLLGIALEAI